MQLQDIERQCAAEQLMDKSDTGCALEERPGEAAQGMEEEIVDDPDEEDNEELSLCTTCQPLCPIYSSTTALGLRLVSRKLDAIVVPPVPRLREDPVPS